MDRTYESHMDHWADKVLKKRHDHHARCRSSRGLPVGSVRCTCKDLHDRDAKIKEYALLKAKYVRVEIFAQLYGSDELKAFLEELEEWKMEDPIKDEEKSECDCEDRNLSSLEEKEE